MGGSVAWVPAARRQHQAISSLEEESNGSMSHTVSTTSMAPYWSLAVSLLCCSVLSCSFLFCAVRPAPTYIYIYMDTYIYIHTYTYMDTNASICRRFLQCRVRCSRYSSNWHHPHPCANGRVFCVYMYICPITYSTSTPSLSKSDKMRTNPLAWPLSCSVVPCYAVLCSTPCGLRDAGSRLGLGRSVHMFTCA